ncbi:MAG: glycine zipper 2TM domain-containing protein [Rhodoferax sp.]|uniref:glycine zipper 2TM domain-containing protein n=1 Tax=Rhodoferax sp. TaxID=50421 RepID=UPI002ACD54AC|nr:glycine zipper 2TM domain-containing protein [Rhodoferax sp.]MDZ7890473.1 glycine zipper 2TM domain-containing protein [Rhodoferax sp.]
MSTVVSHPAVVATGNKFLWGAIGALSVSTLALGAVVLHQQTKTAAMEAPIEVLAISTPAVATPVVTAASSVAAPETAPASLHAEKRQSKPASTQVNQAPRATKVVAQPHAAKAPATPVVVPTAVEPPLATTHASAQAPVKVPAKAVCIQCGVIEGVTPIQRESANPSGAGAVAGAVLGGLVGNQFGGGDGKALATIAGVLGGGWAGNTVEKRLKKDTVYQVDVRMEDGSLRTVEQSTAPTIGQAVTLDGNRISPAAAAADRNSRAFPGNT